MASAVFDQPSPLQFPGSLGDAFAANPEHVGDQFLSHDQFVRRQAVQAQQQPAAELLIQGVMAVAHCRLGHLGKQGLGVAQQQMLHETAALEVIFHQLASQPVAVSGALHHGATGGGFSAHEQGNADHALVAHHGNLGGCPIFHDVEQGDDGAGGKEHVAHLDTRLIQHMAQRHRHQFQIRQQTFVVLLRQRGKQVVLARFMKSKHYWLPGNEAALMAGLGHWHCPCWIFTVRLRMPSLFPAIVGAKSLVLLEA
jgi:hypothetical protein